ncbi:MAG: hypothetical protein KF816_15925 [Melioribacteraceae bacterium]|nr:hypothetical protein [Melioribacteraceae bacterium]
MKNLITFLGLLLIISFGLTTQSAAQKSERIGKIFKKAEAHALFGRVFGTAEISKADLLKAVKKAGKYMYFNLKNGKPVVVDAKRRSLIDNSIGINEHSISTSINSNSIGEFRTPETSINENEIYAVYSTEVVEEFLALDDLQVVLIERRGGVISLSTENNVLEMSTMCPPYCLD